MKQFSNAIRNNFPLLMLLFFMNISASYCQSEKHLSIGIGPFAYFDPITPSLNIHVEAKIYKLLRIDVAYGIDVSEIAIMRWHPNSEFRHHEFKLGLKHFFSPIDEIKHFVGYSGIEYFSVLNDYEKANGQYINNREKLLFDSASTSRNVHGIRLKLGVQKVKNAIGFDIYIGGGIRHLNIIYNTTNERVAGDLWEVGEWFSPIDETAGARLKLDINLGFKIFYVLCR